MKGERNVPLRDTRAHGVNDGVIGMATTRVC
jgi:hypothetical protein